ncbi:hypothetical protein BOX15_Mlig019289g1, partial [Macrostomum lignano]
FNAETSRNGTIENARVYQTQFHSCSTAAGCNTANRRRCKLQLHTGESRQESNKHLACRCPGPSPSVVVDSSTAVANDRRRVPVRPQAGHVSLRQAPDVPLRQEEAERRLETGCWRPLIEHCARYFPQQTNYYIN